MLLLLVYDLIVATSINCPIHMNPLTYMDYIVDVKIHRQPYCGWLIFFGENRFENFGDTISH